MEHHELIAKARAQFGKILPDNLPPLSPDDYPRVRVRETAMLDFESENRKDQVFVLLDLATGEFIGGGVTAPGQKQDRFNRNQSFEQEGTEETEFPAEENRAFVRAKTAHHLVGLKWNSPVSISFRISLFPPFAPVPTSQPRLNSTPRRAG